MASMAALLRRGAAFDPRSIAGLQLWLDANDLAQLFQDSALTTPVAADGDPIGGWKDKSGVGNNVSQSTSTKRPLYKTAIVNGRPVARFDGVDDILARANIFGGTADYTVFVVGRYTAGTIGTFFAERSTSNSLPVHGQIDLTAGNIRNLHRNDANNVSTASVAAPASGTWAILQGSQATLAQKVRVNGGSAGTATATAGATTVSNTSLGALSLAAPSGFLTGDIAEVLVYNSALSNANLDLIGAYLTSKYGLTWAAAA